MRLNFSVCTLTFRLDEAYAGTTPRVKASGGKVRYGGLRVYVNRYLKWAFAPASPISIFRTVFRFRNARSATTVVERRRRNRASFSHYAQRV